MALHYTPALIRPISILQDNVSVPPLNQARLATHQLLLSRKKEIKMPIFKKFYKKYHEDDLADRLYFLSFYDITDEKVRRKLPLSLVFVYFP